MIESDNLKKKIKTIKKEYPELKMLRKANGDYYFINLPKECVRANSIFDFLIIQSDFKDYYVINQDQPIIVKKNNEYVLGFFTYEYEIEWWLKKSELYILPITYYDYPKQ